CRGTVTGSQPAGAAGTQRGAWRPRQSGQGSSREVGMRKITGLGLAGLVVVGLVSGCSGSANGPAGGAVRDSARGAAGPGPAAPPQAGSGSAPGRNAPPAGNATNGNASARIAPARALVRTADLTVAVRDVVAQSRRAVVIATEAGGDMYGEQLNTGTTPAE